MPVTRIAVYEYNQTTKSYVINAGVVRGNSIWDDCITALNSLDVNYRPEQCPGQTIRSPGAWSNPANNIGNAAVSTRFGAGVLADPHVHGGVGVGHRAAIGCVTNDAPAIGGTYPYMKIYIGEFS
ncbi:hypothetical protein [Pseudoalteromonas denitrificans]|uniref:Uncharacterized protein n=1 Tax=Pseudoalteromonas denitrificans DSM 6059 TaxID=1123010 RepID=A0A1I1NGW4_9GAMM|nr:hypothetical protein [Pseudoalteromonas denitrificans]SFC96735.1 hypothetical protein SAMN02745724_03076 [Pseudoalteromonas denitrificans DSM 6059]